MGAAALLGSGLENEIDKYVKKIQLKILVL
jgi:hypothetical protein